ncbi:DNA-deoxyinosine glycosylase [Flavobacterium sp. UBA6031]|uniref:DNA-deoxyinosine glycosylase n=1 Tax=Flavobacterium sp. UBA6031 TaxID=1946551 RepID=UPI0025C23D5D|nr:DNA-deoxyinosine glycosylase [Flavobacterium sp. UBA6031]
MKGKSKFTQSDINAIIALIRMKLKASTSEQAAIRNKIRALGFYASDFGIGGGYTENDFLQATTIIGEKKIVLKPEAITLKPKITDITNQVMGLEPIYDENSSILILGTMPGEESLLRQEYYGNPRNLFWKLISEISRENAPTVYDKKKDFLHRHGIALWDMCALCVRLGSLDSAIEDETPNDIKGFVASQPNIRVIGLNGGKSANLFRKYVGNIAGLLVVELPSSSPANTGIPWEIKVEKWKRLI